MRSRAYYKPVLASGSLISETESKAFLVCKDSENGGGIYIGILGKIRTSSSGIDNIRSGNGVSLDKVKKHKIRKPFISLEGIKPVGDLGNSFTGSDCSSAVS